MANGYDPGDYLGQFLNQLPQMYQAKKNAELQRERFEYYKGKDAQAYQDKQAAKLYNQNVTAWTQIQNFAKEMPFGQQANFLRKQLNTLPPDFVESQDLNKFIDNYEVIESNEVDQISMYDNAMMEDNPGKIDLTIKNIQNPTRKRQLLSHKKRIESAYFKQKPFDINKLTLKEQDDYNTYSKLLRDSRATIAQMSLPGLSEKQKREYAKSLPYQEAIKNIPFLQTQLDPLIKKGAPITIPEFNYSPESLKALTDDPDLMSSFLASPEDDMDAFYNSVKSPTSPPTSPPASPPASPPINRGITKSPPEKSMWAEDKVTVSIAGKPKVVTGGFKLKPNAPSEYQGKEGEQKRQREEAALLKQIKKYESDIANADKQIASIDRAIQNLSGKNLESAKKQREIYLRRKNKASEGLAEVQPKYDYIKKPTR